jgi:GAF domain-containing protein
VLYEVISTVGSTLELDEVLRSVVRLLSDASAVHACFVYLIEERGERLVLRAASAPYDELVGIAGLARGEGLGWAAVESRRPAFIRDGAEQDPRFKHVPGIDDPRFQSLVSVPMLGRDGAAIGTITMHTEAPREFSEAEVEFLVSCGSLVAGAVENARLYSDARRRVWDLEHLAQLGEAAAAADTIDELLAAAAEPARELLAARECLIYRVDRARDVLRVRGGAPPDAVEEARETIGTSELGPELARSGRHATVAVPLIADEDLVGLLIAVDSDAVELARAVANQLALAVRKIELIEQLRERNRIRDFLDALAAGRASAQAAERLGVNLGRPHVVLLAAGAGPRLERHVGAAVPGALIDSRDGELRALLPAASDGRVAFELDRADATAVGLSNPCSGAAAFAAGFDEARYALLGAQLLAPPGGVMAYEDLGAYQYLLRTAIEPGARDAARERLAVLAAYDADHRTALVATLEAFLARRGNISATSSALYIHPNTLRQRLHRIGELTGIDLATEDWLKLEIALRLARLSQARGDDPHIPGARSV